MSSLSFCRAVAIFAARETSSVLEATVRAVIEASSNRHATIDVLINGNQELACQFAELSAKIAKNGCSLRIWSIATPDKAHTWNEYVHRIWDANGTTFFVDGYARVRPDALDAIQHHLTEFPGAMAASGVPTCGRSAKRLRQNMLRTGGIHGNLYALTGSSMNLVRNAGFRFPLGLYRNDPFLGAALNYQLDPARNKWNPESVAVVPEATWDVDGISKLNYKNVLGYFKRKLRQAHGLLESRAFREHMAIKRLPPQLLPTTSQAMINNWMVSQPKQARSLFLRQPLCLYASRQLRAPRNWTSTNTAPQLMYAYEKEKDSKLVE